MANRFTISVLLFLAGLCLVPARPAAADDKEKKPAATRPGVSEEVAPLEAIAPVAKDGHNGEAFLRKPPGKGPFMCTPLAALMKLDGRTGKIATNAANGLSSRQCTDVHLRESSKKLDFSCWPEGRSYYQA